MNVIHVNFLRRPKNIEDLKTRMEKVHKSKPVANLEVKASEYDQETLNINERHDIERGNNTLS